MRDCVNVNVWRDYMHASRDPFFKNKITPWRQTWMLQRYYREGWEIYLSPSLTCEAACIVQEVFKAEVYGTIKKKKKAGKQTMLPWNGANSKEWDVSYLPSSSDASWWCSWLSSSPPRRWSETVWGVCSTSCWVREGSSTQRSALVGHSQFVSALGWNLAPSWQLSVFWVSFSSSLN